MARLAARPCRFAHAALLLAVLALGCGRPGKPEPWMLGQISLSSAEGLEARHGAELALAEGNAVERPPDHGRWVIVQTTVGDKPEDVQRAAVRLIALHHATGLVADTGPANAEVLARVAAQYHLPLVTTCWLPARSLQPYAFTVASSPSARGPALAASLAEAAKVAVVIDGRSEEAALLADAFIAALPAGARAKRIRYSSAAELGAASPAVAEAAPAAILFTGPVAEFRAFRKALFENQVPGTVPVLFSGEEGPLAEALEGYSEDRLPVWWTTPFLPGETGPAHDFAAAFEKRHHAPAGAAAALAHDAVQLLVEAQRQARTTDGTKVRDVLAGLKDIAGTTGPMSMGPDHGVDRPVLVVQRIGDKVVVRPRPAR